MNATRSARREILLAFLGGLFVVPVVPAVGDSVEGRVAAARVREESYRHYLDDMLYTHAGDDRSVTGPEHDPARDNIEMLLTSFGLTVTLEPFLFDYPEPDTVYYNVVATKLGTTYPDQVYIVSAHYDSAYPFTEHGKAPLIVDPRGEEQGVPGADDNASGVALVLEAARVLSQYDSQYTIRFIAFDAEEWGKVGSFAYVEDHIDEDIVGVANADMVAYNNGTNGADIKCTAPSEPLQNALAQAVDAYANGLSYNLRGDSAGSDQWSFEKAGFQACQLTEARPGSPFWHTMRDNVEEQDYLDYTYATRITRSMVGFLVDNAGVIVDDIPDADYDSDGDVDADDHDVFVSCYTGPGIPPENPDCNFFDFESDGDVDCADWDLFLAVWTEPPVAAPIFPPCEPECVSSTPQPETLFEPTGQVADAARVGPVSVKNRYLSVRAGDAGRTQAIRVVVGQPLPGSAAGSAATVPAPFDAWQGEVFFAGPPVQVCENSGQGSDVDPQVPHACGPAPGQPQNWFWVAPLLCEQLAHLMDWTTLEDYCNGGYLNAHPCSEDADCIDPNHPDEPGTCGVDGVVHLYHEAIVPSHMETSTGPIDVPAEYYVSVTDLTCRGTGEDSYSPPLEMTQAGWGDVVLSVADCPNGAPEESIGVVTDVVAILNKFSNSYCAPRKTRVDIHPHNVDFKIGITDITSSLGGFAGDDYPFGAGNCYCVDPTCTVKQCSGGPDHGNLCTDDSDCSSDPCTLELSRELGETQRKRNLPLVDAERDGGLR